MVCTREKTEEESEPAPDDDSDWDTEEEDEEEEEKVHPGYFRRFCSGLNACVILIFATFGAVLLCLLYIIGSIILWCVGICMIFKWCETNWNRKDDDIPEAMPGQEHGHHWERAWELATLRNHGVREDGSQAHFHVVPFLKSKTGVDMKHLTRLTKARDEKTKSEEELADVDRKLPAARIDLRHLSDMVKRRADKKRKAGSTSAKPGTSSGSGGVATERGGASGVAVPSSRGGVAGVSHSQAPEGLVVDDIENTTAVDIDEGVGSEEETHAPIDGSFSNEIKTEIGC